MSSNTIMTSNQQESVAGEKIGDEVYLKTVSANSIMIPAHDSFEVTYTGANPTTIEYYIGGLSGTLVATQTLTYNGNNDVVTGVITYP